MTAKRKPAGAAKAAPDLSELIAKTVAAAMAPVMAELAEVKAQALQGPRFKPMEAPALTDRFHGVQKGQQKDGFGNRMLQGADSHAVPDWVMYSHPNQFEAGDAVMINPETIRDGADRPWSEVLTKVPACNGYGEVLTVDHFSKKTGNWKYKVKFNGLTDRRGDGFYESELLPA